MNPFRILENPSRSVFNMVNVCWMFWEHVGNDRFVSTSISINERVCDQQLDVAMPLSQRKNVIRIVVMNGLHPLRNTHFNDSKLRFLEGNFEVFTRARIARVDKAAPICVFKTISIRVNRFVVQDSEALPLPAIDLANGGFHKVDTIKCIIETSGVSKFAQMLETFFHAA